MIFPSEHTRLFVKEHENDDTKRLALKAHSYPHVDFPFALKQIAGRQIAKQKIPTWYLQEDIIYPQHLSMEQSSSERTAVYKTNLLEGDNHSLIDLTGGLGVDFSFMSHRFRKAVYVERQPELVRLARHNFNVLGMGNAMIIQDEAESFLQSLTDSDNVIFVDPARRDISGRKTVLIEDCTPNLIEIDELLSEKSYKVIIKLSPMLDISHALNSLSNISQVHIVSLNNETKELILVKEKSTEDVSIHCVNLLNDDRKEIFCFYRNQEEAALAHIAASVCKYLYEPNSSIMKAGAYKSIALSFGVNKLHANSHLYTSDRFIPDFPGRKFIVKKTFSLNKKDIKQNLDIAQANISTRNFPFSVADIRKQTKLKEGGTDYIFATTLSNEKKVLILCEKADS